MMLTVWRLCRARPPCLVRNARALSPADCSSVLTLDATNTLLELRESPGVVYSRVAAEHNLQLCPSDADVLFPQLFRQLSRELPNFGRDTDGWRCWWRQLVCRLLEQCCPLTYSRPVADAVSARLLDVYAASDCWRVRDGVLPTLQTLSDDGWRLAVLSNFDPRLHGLLDGLALTARFERVLVSYELGSCKPDGRLFELAAGRMPGATRLVHAGDSAPLDYRAARRAGWQARLVGGRRPNDVPEEHFCHSIAQLPNSLRLGAQHCSINT